MNMFLLYFALQVSSVLSAMYVAITLISIFLVLLLMFCGLKWEIEDEVNSKLLNWVKIGAATWVVLIFLTAFIPSTQTMLVLIGIHEVMQLDGIAELPQDLVDLIKKTLEDLK